MKLTNSEREPRSRLVSRVVDDYITKNKIKWSSFADDVRKNYFSSHPDPVDREVEFHNTGNGAADLLANAQLFKRRIRGVTKFECDLEEAVVDALPAEERMRLKGKLSERYGLLAVPDFDGATVSADVSQLLKECGEALAAYGPLLEDDNEINERDSMENLTRGLSETEDVVNMALGIRAVLTKSINKKRGIIDG